MKPGDVHVSTPLTNLAIKYRNPAFKASEVMPIIPVKFESDKYYKFYKEELRRIKSLRAMGAEAHEVEWTVTTETYTAEEYALKKLVPDRLRANSDIAIRPEMTTTEKLLAWIYLDYEMRMQEYVQNTANVQSSATPTVKWNGGGTKTIEADIDAAKKSVRQNAGADANSILMSPDVKDVVKKDSVVRDLIRYTMPNAATLLTSGELPPILWNLKTIVPGCVNDTANAGQSVSIADVWNDNVLVSYVDPSPSLDALTYGYTMRVRQGGRLEVMVQKWRENARKGDMIEVSVIQDEKSCANECAYLITDTIH